MDGVSFWVGIIPLFAVLFTWGLSEAAQWRRQQIQKREEKRRVALAIKTEVFMIREKLLASPTERVNDPPGMICGNYFAVFDSNAGTVTQFRDAEGILEFYGKAKIRLDSMQSYDAIYRAWQANSSDPHIDASARRIHTDLEKERDALVKQADEVMNLLDRLIKEAGH